MTEARLLIMAKRLALGQAKTRLAASVGDEVALEVYKALLSHTLQVALNCRMDVHVFLTGSGEEDIFHGYNFSIHEQSSGDLGTRMLAAFAQSGFSAPDQRSIVIGSDCADLTENHLERALVLLEEHDVVFGPSNDGGYYLLGMKQPCSVLFENIAWSTETVLDDSLNRLTGTNLSVGFLDVLNDIDTFADLESSRIYNDFRDQLNKR